MSQDVWIVAPPMDTADAAAWLFALREPPALLGTADEVTERLRSAYAALGGPADGTTGSDLGLPFELGAVDLIEEHGLVTAVAINRPRDIEAFVWHLNRRFGSAWRIVDIGAGEELPLVERTPFAV